MGIIHTAKKGLPEVLTAKLKALERESIERREGSTRELNTAENVEVIHNITQNLYFGKLCKNTGVTLNYELLTRTYTIINTLT